MRALRLFVKINKQICNTCKDRLMQHVDKQRMLSDPDERFQKPSDGSFCILTGRNTGELTCFQGGQRQSSEEESHEIDKDPGQERDIVGRPEAGCYKAQKSHEISAVQRDREHPQRVKHDPDVAL